MLSFLQVESDAISVLEVKNLIAEKIGIPVGKQSLVFKGKTLTGMPLRQAEPQRMYKPVHTYRFSELALLQNTRWS